MKRMILLLMAGILMMSPAYAEDDDSVPYFPYQEPQQQQQTQTQKAPVKKTTTTKKKTPVKKTTTKKVTTKKKPAPKPAPKPTPKLSSLQQGIALMQQDKYEQAKPYLLRAIRENRNNPNAWYWYGVYHEKIGGFSQAQYFYSKAVTIDPTFEPLSRVVYYPEDSEKTPLWDPKRPARVYPVEVASTGGLSTVPAGIPGRSSFPEAPNDPKLPHVPVYTPPEPGAAPLDGDAWSPAVYVPPSPEEIQGEGVMSPTYVPPNTQSIIATNSPTAWQVRDFTYRYPDGYNEQAEPSRNDIVRADKPLYNPPNPGEKIQTPPTPSAPKQIATAKKQTTSTSKKSPARKNTKTTKRKTTTKKAPAARTVAQPAPRDESQETTAQPTRPTTPQTPPPPEIINPEPEKTPQVSEPSRPETPRPENTPQVSEPSRPERPREPVGEYLPPVGQQNPNPEQGRSLSDAPMPPVGQGSPY